MKIEKWTFLKILRKKQELNSDIFIKKMKKYQNSIDENRDFFDRKF